MIGAVSREVAGFLGALCISVVISAATYEKQADHHPEIRPECYALLSVIFQEGEVYECVGGKVQFLWEAGAFGFEATVKVTARGELYMVSFFRSKRGRMEKIRRQCRRIH